MQSKDQKALLLVEDEALIALGEETALKKFGYKVLIAGSGEAAIQTVKAGSKIDLILMDIDLGKGIDGTETARRILLDRDIPILFLSGHTEPEVVEKTEKITSFGYVVKNSSITVLDASIKMAFKLFEADKLTKEANTKLKAFIGSIPDLMVVVDIDGYIRSFEKGAEAILALPEERMVGAHISEIYSSTEAATHLEVYRKCIETGEVQELEPKILVDGKEHIVEIRISKLDDRNVLAIIRDVTERERANLEFQKLSLAIEQSSAIVVITDLAGNIDYVNPKFIETTGYSFEDVKGKNPRLLQSGLVPPEVYRDLWTTIAAGKTWHGSFINKKKNGQLYYESANISPVRNKDGKIINYIAVKEDVTKRKLAEEALEKSRALLNKMGKIGKIGGWRADMETGQLEWTEECYSIYEVEARSVPTVEKAQRFLTPSSREVLEKSIRRMLETGEEIDVELEIVTAKGTHKWIRNIGRLEYTDGKLTGRTGVMQDITEWKKAEHAILESEEIFEQFMYHSPVHVYIKDEDLRFVKLSKSFEPWLGKSIDEMLDKDSYSALPSDYSGTARADDLYVIQNGTVVKKEDEIGGKFFSIIKFPIHRGEGRPDYLGGFTTDITERKQAQEEMAENKTLLAEMGKIGKIGAWKINALSQRIEWTDEMREIYELDPATTPTLENVMSFFSPESRERLTRAVEEVMRSGTSYDLELEITTAKGNRRWIRTLGSASVRDGEIGHRVGIVQDITERKKIENTKTVSG